MLLLNLGLKVLSDLAGLGFELSVLWSHGPSVSYSLKQGLLCLQVFIAASDLKTSLKVLQVLESSQSLVLRSLSHTDLYILLSSIFAYQTRCS